jgi:uridine phosphorylase
MTTLEIDEPLLTAAAIVQSKIANGILPNILPPRNVILCFQSSLLRYVTRKRRTKKVTGFLGDVFLLNETHGQTAIAGNFGIGAPAAVALMEELVAFGARRLIALGFAGGLQADLHAGDLIICERAVRDEGTSRHYLPAEKFAKADTELTRALSQRLDPASLRVGTSWTTDAPYREMKSQVEQYRQEGILSVEMEAAALFAAGASLGVSVSAAFVIADVLNGWQWQIDFDRMRVERGLQILFDAAHDVFQESQ